MLLGVFLVFLVVGLRRIWMGFIFHPLGVVVAAQLAGILGLGQPHVRLARQVPGAVMVAQAATN